MAAKPELEKPPSWGAFAVELALYAAFVAVYFYLALHFLSGWFKHLFDHDRNLFAVMALVVMIGQTAGLELVCAGLLRLVRGRRK